MDENYKKWLESLKIGDKVVLEISNYGDVRNIFTEIVKITPKKAIRVKWNDSYLFKNGETDSGGKWSSTYYRLKEITPEIIQEENRKLKIQKIVSFKEWNKLDSIKINQIYDIIYKLGDEKNDKPKPIQ